MQTTPLILGSIAIVALVACGSGSSTGAAGTGGHGSTHVPPATEADGGLPMIVHCNPFTAAECDTAKGQSCDFDGAHFSCFDPPNDAGLCGVCGVDAMTYCGVGMTCLGSRKCARFCCDDGDCGAGGKCDLGFLDDPHVGVCADAAASMADGGDTADNLQPACNAPATPPSMGSCYVP